MTESSPLLETARDYLGLLPEQRYAIVSQRFPDWLLAEPIEFPPHHPTFGWACRVADCEGALATNPGVQLCVMHDRLYRQARDETSFDEFVREAEPVGLISTGWALRRRPSCRICGPNREMYCLDYCNVHQGALRKALARGIDEASWRGTQTPLPPYPHSCFISGCVHDGELTAVVDGVKHHLCRSHQQRWRKFRKASDGKNIPSQWKRWLADTFTSGSVAPNRGRGTLSLARLPVGLQQEIRYAIHRYATTAKRTHWRPVYFQKLVNVLEELGVDSLSDPAISNLAYDFPVSSGERRIMLDLPYAARSLAVTEEMARDAGWFDPAIVGAAQFSGSQGVDHRRKAWVLTSISQRWLRDLLWHYLRDEALKAQGKRLSAGTVHQRVSGVFLLSFALRQIREDHGENPDELGSADAKLVKETWDVWFREQVPLPSPMEDSSVRQIVLTAATLHRYASCVRVVLLHSRDRHRTSSVLDSLILSLPEYPSSKGRPRPRPLSYADFQLLVSDESLDKLSAADTDDLGFADVWLAQAFQGGRIGETLNLRLGCVGLLGLAQPYIWRDISKVGVVDWGMPCHLPVYERLLLRREKTLAKLRARYADELAVLDERGRVRLVETWDRDMPLFPSALRNPDLVVEISQCRFREVWTAWFQSLGLSGITTHQTRATLATSLLNNGAPPDLVRQMLGHFSHEALAHYARYNDTSMRQHLNQVWAAGPGMDKPGTILLRPEMVKAESPAAAAARIDLTVVPVEHGLCRYGPVVGGSGCPFGKNCVQGPLGACEHFVLTGSDLAYWERKRDAAYHFAEGAPNAEARDYILDQWQPWEPVLASLRETLDELGLLEEAEKLDLRAPVHDYFDPLFSTGWLANELKTPADRRLGATEL